MKQPSIIGVNDWDPTGESAVTICRKIGYKNNFSQAEATKFFGINGSSSHQNDLRIAHPSNKHALNIPWICHNAAWDITQFNWSFPERYVRLILKKPYLTSVALMSGLRICEVCATEGVHLLIHQLPGFRKCPLHQQQLIRMCPSCQHSLSEYAYTQFNLNPFACDHCGWFAWNGISVSDSFSLAARHQILRDYDEWMQRISDVIKDRGEEIKLIRGPFFYTRLMDFAALVTGPEWIEQCLE